MIKRDARTCVRLALEHRLHTHACARAYFSVGGLRSRTYTRAGRQCGTAAVMCVFDVCGGGYVYVRTCVFSVELAARIAHVRGAAERGGGGEL